MYPFRIITSLATGRLITQTLSTHQTIIQLPDCISFLLRNDVLVLILLHHLLSPFLSYIINPPLPPFSPLSPAVRFDRYTDTTHVSHKKVLSRSEILIEDGGELNPLYPEDKGFNHMVISKSALNATNDFRPPCLNKISTNTPVCSTVHD